MRSFKIVALGIILGTLGAFQATAGGISPPIVSPPDVIISAPPVADWDGLYVGLEASATSSSEDYSLSYYYDCEWLTEEGEHVESTKALGGFVGYRIDTASGIVYGIELGANEDLKTLELSAGLGLGGWLPYAAVGIGQLGGQDGKLASVGLDRMVGESLAVGIDHTVGEFGEVAMIKTGMRAYLRF